ncbi:MAG: restriction endonuclease subunit S [Bacteroidota bacterium]|nr:restriction endonuclease subunit S [Bacteroidota bacterium]
MGEVFTIERGGSPRPIEDYITNNVNGINWIKIGDTKNVIKYIYETKEKIKPEGIKKSRMVYEGDFILSNSMSFGKPFIMKTTGCIHDGWLVIRKNELLDNNYLFYILSSSFVFKQFSNLAKGSTVKNLNIDDVKQVEIRFPPLVEQQLIVSKIEQLFSELENGKQQLETAQQQLKVYRQSLLKWAFEGKLTNKNVKEGELPKGWKWVKLGEVCSSVEYGSATKSKKTGSIPVLRMGNIQNGIFDWNDLVFTDNDAEIKKYLLKKNDVLFNRTNSAEWVGKTAIYKGERPAIFAGYLIRINRIESLIDASYLTYFLNTHFAKSYGNTVRSFGVNQSNINGTKLKTYPIPLPTIEEQHLIVQELESKLTICDKIEETITNSLQQAETLRQSILKKAFEGRLIN